MFTKTKEFCHGLQQVWDVQDVKAYIYDDAGQVKREIQSNNYWSLNKGISNSSRLLKKGSAWDAPINVSKKLDYHFLIENRIIFGKL